MTQAANPISFPFNFNGNISLREAARIYIGAGFSIIPLHWITRGKCSCGKKDCSSPAKHPLTQHGLKDASCDLAQIKDWWKKFPKANIGVCTGQVSGGLIVIDVDVVKGGKITAVDIPITLEVETGNGFHFWLRSNQEIHNSAGKLGQGIDIRGWGGYVVAPPSLHSNGRIYTFRNQDPIAELPAKILAQLIDPEPEPETDDPTLILSYSPDMADFASEGSRNDFLTSIGGRLRRQGFSTEEIESMLLTANLKRCNPPLIDKEVRKIAWSVGRYIPVGQIETTVNDPAPDDMDMGFDPDLDQQSTGQPAQSNQSTHDPFAGKSGRDPLIGAITSGQFRVIVYGRSEMILQGLFKGDWGLVVGKGGLGKTTFLLNVCICLASGKPFAPIVPEGQPPRRVLYLDFESNPQRLQEQFLKVCEQLTDDENLLVDENLQWAFEPEIAGHPWRMTDPQALKNLAKYIQQHKIDFVIVDTVSQAAALNDENNNAEVQRKIVVPIRRLVKYCDIGMLLVHHEGKGKTQTGIHDTQYRARGASALMDAARYQITLLPFSQDNRGLIEVVNSKDKGYRFDKVTMSRNEATHWFSLVQSPPPKPAPKVEDLIIDVLEMSSESMTTKDISALLPGTSKATLFRALKDLMASGRIIKVEHGQYQTPPNPLDDLDEEPPPDTP